MSETDWGQWGADTTVDKQEKSPQFTEDSDLPSTTTINNLGEYELIKIFDYFPLKERLVLSWVCLKWKDSAEKSFKSETILNSNIIDPKFGSSHRLTGLLLHKCFNVRHISLTGITFTFSCSDEEHTKEVEHLITSIATNCSQLKSIDFGAVRDLDEVFIKNANYFLRLKKIYSVNISGEALNSILSSENLETIDVNRNDRLINVEFKRLGPKIRELHLIESNVFKTCDIDGLCEGNGKNIEIISIDIKEKEVLSLICNNLKKLKELKLCLYTEECDFKRFAHLSELKSLQIAAKDSVFKSEEFIDLIHSLQNTKVSELRIDLSSMNNIAVTDDSLQVIRMKCPFIEKLIIKGANCLTGTGMYSIAQLKHLKHLNLKNCSNISDQIEIVITSCPLLRELILHSCSHITNESVLPFIQKAKTLPNENFFLDVIETNISYESLPLFDEWPKNLKILYETDDCSYSSCEHGWGPDGYHSGPDDYDNDIMDNLDLYVDDDADDYYDDYGDEDIDYEFS